MAPYRQHCILEDMLTMEAFACSRYIGVISLLLFLLHLWCTLLANAQPGFLSIDCGGKGNYTDSETNITWVPDDNYIVHSLGEKAESYLKDEGYAFYLESLRVFPKPINKACYELRSLTPNVPHLLRLSFLDANSTGSRGFSYSVETIDMLYMDKVLFSTYSYTYELVQVEKILYSADSVLHICLIRTSDCYDPFISAIELRRLKRGMYDMAKPGIMLDLIERDNWGPDVNTTRYPEDPFDRFWYPWELSGYDFVNVSESISINNTKNFPPLNVMKTAVVGSANGSEGIDLSFGESPTGKALVLLYFAELNSSQAGSFSVRMSNTKRKTIIDLKKAIFSATEMALTYEGPRAPIVSLEPISTSPHRPIINAAEMYSIVASKNATFRDDVNALIEVWKALFLNNSNLDPCFGLPWEGIFCSNVNNTVRISAINLSSRNLTGPIPPSFGQLTELVSLSLDNNHFNGKLPNWTSLSKLKTLHLQNNYLSDKFPDWLSKLPRLKEVDISNNDFKGVIPQQLLNKINFTIHGNKHLCRTKRECRHHFPSIAVGLAGAFITIVILVGIVIYQLKFRSACAQPSPLDYLMVNVANSSKSRAFTLEAMTTATENFTRKIGQGSFGNVFLGELKEGKQIAVKVLSVFSKHGIEQFLNEVDLLSKINHKKLVSFLGYCNESRDLMLVYEYMSGGSLSDNLYDPEAPKYSQLDWKTRLKIALDAAQGLEYLHVGCTPKIIHRDVKTSNILLDSNLNGKLADLGLSRVTGNGETSQINTTIKGTPGYLDPMYYRTHMLTDKSDVYSFGVVLLELICGRKPIDLKVSAEKILLTEWVASYMDANEDDAHIEEIVDKRLGKRYNVKSIAHLTNLSRRCIASEPSDRPSISEVVVEIKEIVTFEEENYQVPDELSLTSTASFSSSL